MKEITLRDLDDELWESIRSLAQHEGIFLNQAALKLLRRGAGLSDVQRDGNTIEVALDDLFGTWSPEEAEEFNTALEVFETTDRSVWG